MATSLPQTIEELKQWYKDRNLPDENTTRFFIGKNYTGPKAFGIYKDEETGNFIVYKNKEDGSRAIRYEGNDEAFAVNELFQKLKEEIRKRKSPQSILDDKSKPIGKIWGFLKVYGLLILGIILVFGRTFLKYTFIIGIPVIVFYLFYSILINHNEKKKVIKNSIIAFIIVIALSLFGKLIAYKYQDGYYAFDNETFYVLEDSWYAYDSLSDDWYYYGTSYPIAESDSYDNYYHGTIYSSNNFNTGFTESNYYSTYIDTDDDYDDNDYDWDDNDTWDSDDTDWGSDW